MQRPQAAAGCSLFPDSEAWRSTPAPLLPASRTPTKTTQRPPAPNYFSDQPQALRDKATVLLHSLQTRASNPRAIAWPMSASDSGPALSRIQLPHPQAAVRCDAPRPAPDAPTQLRERSAPLAPQADWPPSRLRYPNRTGLPRAIAWD